VYERSPQYAAFTKYVAWHYRSVTSQGRGPADHPLYDLIVIDPAQLSPKPLRPKVFAGWAIPARPPAAAALWSCSASHADGADAKGRAGTDARGGTRVLVGGPLPERSVQDMQNPADQKGQAGSGRAPGDAGQM